jgi:RNA polymerase subunit RPABC4/transcription elongation factor Spt4
MESDFGAYRLHSQLRENLKNYLLAQYFGKSPVLLKALENVLGEENVLFKRPYIESTPGYRHSEKGIAGAAIPDWLKTFFLQMADAHLGVYKSPYEHQIESLEAVQSGRDLFVATGTGSGKTECFLWPMLAKLMTEAHDRPESWENRAVRCLLLYPMNALVSDQLSRLRRMIGDRQGRFDAIFRSFCSGRRIQFGMYTGRTPYPGVNGSPENDRRLADTLERFLPPADGESEEEGADPGVRRLERQLVEALAEEGRIPAKKDLAAFIAGLRRGEHITAPVDAELLTRFEMRAHTPDILITNYSMLEYMLLRPREQKIWSDTAAWLKASSENRLLVVADEAHMYRGAAGEEVALLIQRLFEGLGIDRSKTQFILTTASMPPNDPSVQRFACDLTGLPRSEAGRFVFLRGHRDQLPSAGLKTLPERVYAEVRPAELEKGESERLAELQRFAAAVAKRTEKFSDLDEACRWLGNALPQFKEFRALIEACRGRAVSLEELAKLIYPETEAEEALRRVNLLLAVAPLAVTDSGLLFPARMHMLFRGITGVYACLNPECPKHSSADGLTLGKVVLNGGIRSCPACGHAVYELVQDRSCGALFISGYVSELSGTTYLWPGSLVRSTDDVYPITLYLPDENFRPEIFNAGKKQGAVTRCWLHTKTGYLSFGDLHRGEPGWRELYCRAESRKPAKSKTKTDAEPDKDYTLSVCPHCEHRLKKGELQSFDTRGNQSFFSLVQTQFKLQPVVPGKDKDPDRYPNQGRKVLIFSDSRQRAAVLARDISEISDRQACREIAGRVLSDFEQSFKNSGRDHEMDEFYPYFAMEAERNHLPLFSDDSRRQVREKGRRELRRLERFGERYAPKEKNAGPDDYQSQFLKLFCGTYNTFESYGLSWFEPSEDMLEESEAFAGLPFSKNDDYRELREFVALWLLVSLEQAPLLDERIGKAVRYAVSPYGYAGSFGSLETPAAVSEKDLSGGLIPEKLLDAMPWKGNAKAVREVCEYLREFLSEGSGGAGSYVSLRSIRSRFDPSHKWLRCGHCSKIMPFSANGRCPFCGSSQVREMTDRELGGLAYWRQPVFDSISRRGRIMSIDTEEHTAQLSFKDQRQELWSKVEDYELRFQDLVSEDRPPVDILSCTTTMEVGIDIGSLVAVSLRNMPPTRENYQQRAGRAGRRGSSLSSILTFCDNGAHDSYYFHKPEEMIRGTPRKPWIDEGNPKLLQRHFNLVLIKDFLKSRQESLDRLSAERFLSMSDELFAFADTWKAPAAVSEALRVLGEGAAKEKLREEIGKLVRACKDSPEVFAAQESLDALFDAGIIPTYSFPIDVVSFYIQDPSDNSKAFLKRIKYQLERGIDVALSEYAPGRTLVVDKKTYQVGGLFMPRQIRGERPKTVAEMLDDPKNARRVRKCSSCGWFGFQQVNFCPLCGSRSVQEEQRVLLRPWGFAPVNGTASERLPDEEYSTASRPQYSTLPDSSEEMLTLWPAGKTKVAFRRNQQIIMRNAGPGEQGFRVCSKCGAAVPAQGKLQLSDVKAPFLSSNFKSMECRHPPEAVRTVDLGFSFRTDMLVFEIAVDTSRIWFGIEGGQTWVHRAAQTLAEALRLSASNLLDIDITELLAGYRLRNGESGAFIDVYLYDSLSSGAGYAVGLSEQAQIDQLFTEAEKILSNCKCTSACHECLEHYYNRHAYGLLDRFSGLDLLRWARNGELAPALSAGDQWHWLDGISDYVKGLGVSFVRDEDRITAKLGSIESEVIVVPSMWRYSSIPGTTVMSLDDLRFNKPKAVKKVLDALNSASNPTLF